MASKKELLKEEIVHVDIKTFNSVGMVDQFAKTAFQARNLARAAKIFERMLNDKECGVIFCLAGSMISAGQKKVIYDMVENNMIDAIVSTGANIVDQDFFEGLGFKHYIGTPMIDDDMLMKAHIDRIYDTFIDEDNLRTCDETVGKICDSLPPKPYSSREFIHHMGKYLSDKKLGKDSIVRLCYEKGVPIFCPAFSDCSAGFGFIEHQVKRKGKAMVTIDSARDFLELTQIKIWSGQTGLFMVGGGVPKNFAQDVVVAADILGKNPDLHKYAIQITVADERDGALSGSTLKEAHSWGKVDQNYEQMVYSEATIAFPIIVSYGYHKGAYKARVGKQYAKKLLEEYK